MFKSWIFLSRFTIAGLSGVLEVTTFVVVVSGTLNSSTSFEFSINSLSFRSHSPQSTLLCLKHGLVSPNFTAFLQSPQYGLTRRLNVFRHSLRPQRRNAWFSSPRDLSHFSRGNAYTLIRILNAVTAYGLAKSNWYCHVETVETNICDNNK